MSLPGWAGPCSSSGGAADQPAPHPEPHRAQPASALGDGVLKADQIRANFQAIFSIFKIFLQLNI
jgi:hypothetical protein